MSSSEGQGKKRPSPDGDGGGSEPKRPPSPCCSSRPPSPSGHLSHPLSPTGERPPSPTEERPPSPLSTLLIPPLPAPTSAFIPVDALHRPSSPTVPEPLNYDNFHFSAPAEEREEFALSAEPEFVPFNYDPTWQEDERDFDEFYEEELKSLDLAYSLDEKDRPIYDGAPITLHESLVSILTLSLKFSLSGSCIQELLKVIELHCKKENSIFKKSLHLFKNYFANIRGAVSYQYFCSTCFKECPDKKKCPDCAPTSNPLCYLIKLPFLDQLQVLMKRAGFFSSLNRKNANSSGYSDINDGNVYKHYVKEGKLNLQTVLSFMWYTDGAAVFKSSKLSVWPLFLIINELPFSERFKKQNILVPVLWCGPVKPHANILLKALYSEMKALEKGVDMEINGHGVQAVQGYIVAGTADLPARGAVLNSVAHNGESSCHRCYQPGESREGCFGVRVFPYMGSNNIPLRKDETFEREGNFALLLRKPYLGWKGITLLSKLTMLPLSSTAIDSMHLLFAGCCKKILHLTLDDQYSKLLCNIKVHQALIDQRLVNIKPPHFLTRTPKPTLQLADWKTSLLKSYCLYFALPVLKGAMSEIYLQHFATFVAAVQLLNAECVTEESINLAEVLIHKFLSYFEDMYGREYLTLNFHLLLHLCDMVRDLGPLWVTSCFPLESINGEIMKMVHGTRFPESQIASSLNVCLALPEIVSNLKESDSKNFCTSLLTTVKNCKSIQVGNLTVIGNIKDAVQVPLDIREKLVQFGLSEELPVSSFYSLRKERCLYVAESHPKIISRDSSCVQFIEEQTQKVGIVKQFYMCSQRVFADVQVLQVAAHFETLLPNVYVPNVHMYNYTNVNTLVECDKLVDVCVKMVVDDKLYIAKRCNRKEIE